MLTPQRSNIQQPERSCSRAVKRTDRGDQLKEIRAVNTRLFTCNCLASGWPMSDHWLNDSLFLNTTSVAVIVRQCTAMYDNVRQCTAMYGNVRQCTAMYGNVRQRTATYGNVRQRTTMYGNVRQCTAMYGNVRQCTAMYGNVRQCRVQSLIYMNRHSGVTHWKVQVADRQRSYDMVTQHGSTVA